MATHTILSLCTGIGGLDLGVHRALGGQARTVCYVERELSVVRVLAAQIAAGRLDDAPIWSDVTTFDGAAWRGLVDGIIAGIPCQPHSVAGKGLGADDPRDLWPVTARILRAVEPGWFLLENVPGILRYYHDRIRPELLAMGYRVAEALVTAAEVGAPHKRERLFVLADRTGGGGARGLHLRSGKPRITATYADGSGPQLADAHRERRQQDAGRAPRDECAEGREPDGDHVATGVLPQLADAGHTERAGWRESACGGEGVARDVAAPRGGAVGHSDGARWEATGGGHGEHAGVESQPASGIVGDAEQPGRRQVALQGTRSPSPGELERTGLPPFPPRPDEYDAWAAILGAYPELRPATAYSVTARGREEGGYPGTFESPIRGVAYGIPAGLARPLSRADKLRALGNGVVPLQATRAMRLLMEELEGVGA